jgi:4-amino-4-deoxy-L-arabinose transferase-like glycosyltransferase
MRRLVDELRRWSPRLLTLLIAVNVVAGVILRFRTTSKLWLDEAQSVNIAAHPITQIPGWLRKDGAPPLYYFLLHYWMQAFGQGDFAVRALSGVFAVLAIGVTYLAARRWIGARDAQLAVGAFAVLPFAVYFGTETRQYALVMLISALIFWVLKVNLDQPKLSSAIALCLLGAALLYTHYWGIYLLGVLAVALALRWWWRRHEPGRRDWLAIAALVGSFVLFLPWVPIFNEQRIHTGTPWAPSPGYYQIFTWFDGFTVNQSVHMVVGSLHSQLTLMLFVGLLLFGVFGLAMRDDSLVMQLNPTGERGTRFISLVVLGTMAAGIVASNISGSAYVPRYAAVIAVPICLLLARGSANFSTPLRILIVFGLFSATCLWTDRWGVGTQRTQAGEIAAALEHAPSNSLVFVCPDQLGPSLVRYANPELTYIGYPRMEYPFIVNWYDYEAQYDKYTPAQNAATQAQRVQPGQPVYVVHAPNYGIKLTCLSFTLYLAQDLHRTVVTVVPIRLGDFYQAMQLDELVARVK